MVTTKIISSNLFRFEFIDSVLVWVDVANCAKQFADPQGVKILNDEWIPASETFNTAMEKGDQATSFKMLNQANMSFKNVAPHIKDANLKAYFLKTYDEFGAKLKTKDIKAINQYMVNVHKAFQNAAEGK